MSSFYNARLAQLPFLRFPLLYSDPSFHLGFLLWFGTAVLADAGEVLPRSLDTRFTLGLSPFYPSVFSLCEYALSSLSDISFVNGGYFDSSPTTIIHPT